jgi:heme-degrading monooxygenase HmoA
MITQPSDTHLAQLNVATAVADLDSPRLADFMGALAGVNALAERAPGFVWRLQSDQGNATDIKVSDDPRYIVNLSVWETAEALEQFVWNTVHKRIYAKRAKWFAPRREAHLVMWWVPAGHLPSVAEALDRLDDLRRNGPSERAFGWESLPDVHLWKEQRCA